MPTFRGQHVKSKFKCVYGVKHGEKIYWRAYKKGKFRCSYKTEREAAKAIDLFLIDEGKEPVNILKRK